MNPQLLIVGAGGFGRVVSEHALKQYDCHFLDDGIEKGKLICGVEVIGNTSDLGSLFGEFTNLIVAIGNNSIREKICQKAKSIGYYLPNIICDTVYVSPYAKIGYGCIALNNVVIQNGSTVGNGVILNPGVEIHHGSTVQDYSCIYTNSVIRTYAVVGKRVKIGSNCTISNNVRIDNDEIIEDGESIHS